MGTLTSPDGTTIDYDRYGHDGPTVVFVSGALQHRAIDDTTARAAQLLAARGLTAIVYDRRGRGRSTDTRPWSLLREVEDLAAIIDAAGGEATLYTSSSGATIALAAAASGLSIEGMVLYEPPFFQGAGTDGHLDSLRSWLDAGAHDQAMGYYFGSVLGLPGHAIDGLRHSPAWAAMVGAAPTLLYDLTAVQEVNDDPDWPARWAALTQPATVCSGDLTFAGLQEAAVAVAAALPHGEHRLVPGQGHNPEPETITALLSSFVALRLC